ncbi:hypothetical protein B0H14DRAFT_3446973 [Mycena olivaceomarginata]|nr:hypothetical protein B0H14DRAFT_3446973 [Mycena olivaceomarginata]
MSSWSSSSRRCDQCRKDIQVEDGIDLVPQAEKRPQSRPVECQGLLATVNVKRLAGFADAAFALWAPRLYQYYRDHNAAMHQRHPDLHSPFGHSIFFCAAFNFGPNVWTFRHRDVLKLAFGWCAVQALGEFDPTKGGHLVLWDLNLVVEFSFRRADLANLRDACTLQCGIFRYVDNGFRTEVQLEEDNPEEYERLMDLKASCWEEGLNLLSEMDELLATFFFLNQIYFPLTAYRVVDSKRGSPASAAQRRAGS